MTFFNFKHILKVHSSCQLLKPRFPAMFYINDWFRFLIGAFYKLCFKNTLQWAGHLAIVLKLNHSALQIAYGNLSYFSKDPVGDSVPE